MTFFGGDPNVAHFVAGVPYEDLSKYRELQDEADREYQKSGKSRKTLKLRKAASDEWARAKNERRIQVQKARDAGFKSQYRQFRVDDERGKATAKAVAEADAKNWSRKLGFKFTVCEGCFL